MLSRFYRIRMILLAFRGGREGVAFDGPVAIAPPGGFFAKHPRTRETGPLRSDNDNGLFSIHVLALRRL
jgi:hypothetical protein